MFTTDFNIDYNGYADDAYTVLANCTFNLLYYANSETWKCTVLVNDTYDLTDIDNDTMNITVKWYLEDVLNQTIDYNNSYINGTNFVSTLAYTNTTKHQNWSCGINEKSKSQCKKTIKRQKCK